jgi:ribonuclease P protein subunit POP4
MPIDARTLVRHELIGLKVKVVKSANPSQTGAEGTVTDETRQTLTIEIEKGKRRFERSFAKDQCVFLFRVPSGELVRVDGKLLVARPEDRIKKKFRKW